MFGGRRTPSFDTALVTGANGFIGRALVRRLATSGVTVTCATRRPMTSPEPGTCSIIGDVADEGSVQSVVARASAQVIFHLAGKVTGRRDVAAVPETLRANLVGTVNMLYAATSVGCDRLILIGSGDEPTGQEAPCSPYAASKTSQRIYAQMFEALYDTPVTTARVFMTYGPDQPDESKLVPYTITSLLRGVAPAISSGRRRCDWIYIDDVVDALVAMAEMPSVKGHVIDVGTGRQHSVTEVVETIDQLVDSAVKPAWGAVEDRALETEHVADVATSGRLIGWSPSTELRAGLAQTVAWYAGREADADGSQVQS